MEENFKDILDNLLEAVYVTDLDRRIVYWNRAAEDLTGFAKEEVLQRVCSENILGHVDRRGVPLCGGQCPLAETMADGKPRETMVFLHHKEGFRRPVRVRTSPLRNASGAVSGGIEVFEDAMGFLALEEKIQLLESLTLLDPLTRIGNRRYLEMQIEEKLREFQISGLSLGFLLFDIDRFKDVNDTWGHLVGDRVLTVVASTLKHSLRIYDVVGRWGGEEFLMVFRPMPRHELHALGRRICTAIASEPVEVAGTRLQVTASLGLIGYPPFPEALDLLGWEQLVSLADRALYEVKAHGRNGWAVYEASPSRSPLPDADAVRHGLSGNLCRCTGYTQIVESVLDAAKEMNHGD